MLWVSRTHVYLSDYKNVLVNKTKMDDFIYLNPPYDPVNTIARFTGYTECGFTDKDQRDLSRIFMKLTHRGCKVLLSNSDTPYIRELYKDFSRHTHQVNALRSISTTKKVLLITLLKKITNFNIMIWQLWQHVFASVKFETLVVNYQDIFEAFSLLRYRFVVVCCGITVKSRFQ